MRTRRLRTWILTADLSWIALAVIAAYLLRYGVSRELTSTVSAYTGIAFLVLTWGAWIVLSSVMDLDGFRGGWRLSAAISHLVLAVSCLMGIVLAIGYLARHYVSRLALSYCGILLLVGFLAIRCAAMFALRARHRSGGLWRAVVLGGDRVARERAPKLDRHAE